MANKSVLLKQYRDLARNIESFTDGQASLKEQTDSDSLDEIFVTFTIKSGPYRGAVIDFSIDTTDFPSSAPSIQCKTLVYHPNIDVDIDDPGTICLNLFDELWSEEITLEDVVQGLLFLFYHANIEDPLSSLFYGQETEDEFERNVRLSLRGKTVEGFTFPRALPDDYESDFDDDYESDVDNGDKDTATPVINDDNNEGTAEGDLDTNSTCPTVVRTASDGAVCETSMVDIERVDDSTLEGATNFVEVRAMCMAEVQPLPATVMVPQDQENIRSRNRVFDVLTNFSTFAYATVNKIFTKHTETQQTIIESSVDVEVR